MAKVVSVEIHGFDGTGTRVAVAVNCSSVESAKKLIAKRRDVGWRVDGAEVVDEDGEAAALFDGINWEVA